MIIDGREIAQNILNDLKKRTDLLKQKRITSHLAIILIGDDPASIAYVRQKELKANEVGIKTTIIRLPSTITQNKLLATIEQLNNDSNIHGIIVQQPLPAQIDVGAVINAVLPQKDVDGFHPQTKFLMPLAEAVLKILGSVDKNWQRKKIVIIGKGETGGGPVINKLRTMNVEPIIIDSKTQNPKDLTKTADIIISSVGKPNMVKADAIKKGVILISVGLHKGEDNKLHGDYEESEIADIAGFYTPTPGGVGPVNVACLLENVVQVAENQISA